ncbi:MAG: ThuA domain-containing protein [Firmicutes bacterium]|nr:ThuA domain-containing protein [Bacillota bacterium]
MIRVTIWNEYIHEKNNLQAGKIYPNGIHSQIASFLKSDDIQVSTATLDMPEHGLTEEVLKNTDVLVWWGHVGHNDVRDEVADRVAESVLKGMGLIALHSAHHSKPFKKLMGTSCNLNWREDAYERLWCIAPHHPISMGVPSSFVLEQEEMYGEPFDIPKPEEVIFTGWYKSGEVFRSGCTFTRGYGKIFYFQPGHETYPIYYNEHVQRIIKNAVAWANPLLKLEKLICPNTQPLE